MDEAARGNLKKGVALYLLAFFFFTCGFALIKHTETHASIPSIVFFRNLVGVLFTIPWMIRHGKASLKVTRPWLVLFRSAIGLIGMLLIFLSLEEVDLVDTSVLMNTAPLFLPFIIWLWMKKPIEHRLWIPILVGFVGVLFVLKPTSSIFHSGSIYGLGAGLISAITALAVRISTKSEEMHTLLFYYFLIGFLLFLPFNLLEWQNPVSFTAFLELLGIGLFSACGQWAQFKGLSCAKASHLAPFSYSGILYAGILQWMFWDNVPDLWAWIGIVLTCGSGLLVLFFTSLRPPRPRAPSAPSSPGTYDQK